MNSNLFSALYTLYQTSNTFNTATGGRYNYGRAKESWSDNYAVAQGLDAPSANTFRTSVNETFFQINLFSTTEAGCWDLLDKCVKLFNGKILTITGHHPSRITEVNQVLPLWNEQDNLYQATAEFTVMIQET